jgi:mono/diheme cytochrome c family protein
MSVLAAVAALLATVSLPALAGNTELTRLHVAGRAGSLATGKKLFKSLGCGACHTLKPAGTRGTVGPNLNVYQPPYEWVITQITNGGGGMPPFKQRLSKVQITDIADFVYNWTSRP